eukprot:5104935-Pyramimonas_sp.AAC.1
MSTSRGSKLGFTVVWCILIQLPAASPATVPRLWVIGFLDVRWGIVGALSGARWRQFRGLVGA